MHNIEETSTGKKLQKNIQRHPGSKENRQGVQ